MPPKVSVDEPPSVMVRLPVSVTAPVPMFRFPVPPNPKSPPQVTALFLFNVFAAPLVLSIPPPLMVSVPDPMADILLMFNVPDVIVVPPL